MSSIESNNDVYFCILKVLIFEMETPSYKSISQLLLKRWLKTTHSKHTSMIVLICAVGVISVSYNSTLQQYRNSSISSSIKTNMHLIIFTGITGRNSTSQNYFWHFGKLQRIWPSYSGICKSTSQSQSQVRFLAQGGFVQIWPADRTGKFLFMVVCQSFNSSAFSLYIVQC